MVFSERPFIYLMVFGLPGYSSANIKTQLKRVVEIVGEIYSSLFFEEFWRLVKSRNLSNLILIDCCLFWLTRKIEPRELQEALRVAVQEDTKRQNKTSPLERSETAVAM